MAKLILFKFDRLLSNLILFIVIGGGMTVHILTALTIKNYYGDPWGYVAFLTPVASEVYLTFIQLGDNMYNYTIVLTSFICIASLASLFWLLKSFVMKRVVNTIKLET